MFHRKKAATVCRFFEKLLKHPKEGLSPFYLLDWQRDILRHVFGTLDEDGLRIIQRVYLEIGKKNGKSELAAGIALYCLMADGEPAAEIYGCATIKKQAAQVFNVAAAMVTASPELDKRLRIVRSTKRMFKRNDPDSFYQVIAADGDTEDGMNPHCVIIDELHRWRTGKARELYEVLTKSGIARRQPLVWEITTAGSTEDESPLAWAEHELTEQITSGALQLPHFYGKIFAIKPTDDWKDPKVWEKANPSLETLGGFLKVKKIQQICDEAIDQPSRQAAFKRFHCGLWLSLEEEWMPIEVWERGNVTRRRLVERPCYIGLDLSVRTDLTALVCLFPDPSDKTFDILPFFFMARDRVRELEQRDRVPYGAWVSQGLIEAPAGNVIDLREVKKKIKWCADVFNVQEIAFDPAHALQLSIELADEGHKCVPIPQRYTHLSEPMKKVMEWSLNKKLRHEGNPVLRWNMNCVRTKNDGADNIMPAKPDRLKSGKRIDGASALINASARAIFHQGSVYDRGGLLFV